ncbi:hypothetical protein C8R44DRAFT_916583 [Mycena epipterygia]|nr:hypothetical protein C8R44DRAFT_916583 [Mycena epipterygia]
MPPRRPAPEGPPRRNPPRSRNAPHRPDSPVTYVPGPIMDESMSDDESVYALSVRAESPPPAPSDNDSDLDILSGPPPMRTSTSEANTMAQVNAPGITYEARLRLLIAQICRLEGTNSPAAAPAVVAPAPAEPLLEGERGPPLTATPPTVGVVSDPIPQYPEGRCHMCASIYHKHSPPIIGMAVFFIGLQVPGGGRTFVEVRHDRGPDSGLLSRLLSGANLLGRALRRVEDLCERYYVGTAVVPVDVLGDYMNHVNCFCELGSWTDLDGAEDSPLCDVTPAPASPARTALLVDRGLSDDVQVWIIYIYHEESDTVLNAAQPVNPQIGSDSVVTAPGAPIQPMAAAASPAAPSMLQHYLMTRFAHQFARIDVALNSAYGTAYRNCRLEKHVISICHALGLNLNLRTFVPVTVEGREIGYSDVILSTGLNINTFGGMRTTVTKALQARRQLGRYIRDRDNRTLAPVKLDTEFRRFFEVLTFMLQESDLDDVHLMDTSGSAESQAMNYGMESFRAMLERVAAALGS